MYYTLSFTSDAKKDLKLLAKHSPESLEKLKKLLNEVSEHPRTGTGQVEVLKGYDGTVYSRRINRRDRLVYKIYEDEAVILVLSAFEHYEY